MNWYNEPPQWSEEQGTLNILTATKTDFWRHTHYGFVRDNGHFYYQTQKGNFQADVSFHGEYTTLYDQAGLMIRVDEANWIKCGIEFLYGVQYVSAVVTRDYSDWSLGIALKQHTTEPVCLRVKREGAAVEIQYALDGSQYHLLRLAYLSTASTVQIGPMCASPQGMGFPVTFENFRVESL